MAARPPDLSPHAVRHDQLAPGSNCPGRLTITGQRSTRGHRVRDDWTCGILLGDGRWPGFETEALFSADLFPVCAPALAAKLRTPWASARCRYESTGWAEK